MLWNQSLAFPSSLAVVFPNPPIAFFKIIPSSSLLPIPTATTPAYSLSGSQKQLWLFNYCELNLTETSLLKFKRAGIIQWCAGASSHQLARADCEPISSQLWIPPCHINNLKLALAGVFILQIPVNAMNQDLFFPQWASCSGFSSIDYIWHIHSL